MKRNKFSLSSYKLFSGDLGMLIPCGLVEVLPGDTVQGSTSALVRCSPLLAPVMHPVHVRLHHWYVPHRLVWEDFEDFITGGPDGMNASVFPTKTVTTGFADVGSLADYLGIPDAAVTGKLVSALPFRGYNMIWNEWYRDQDLQVEKEVDISSGPDAVTDTELMSCAWEKDYFTSSRPWEQKGPAVSIPLGTTAPVGANIASVFTAADMAETAPGTGNTMRKIVDGGVYAGDLPVVADLSNASAVTVNVLREALALQRFEEARARYGSRYTEYLRYLGVRSSDARLQRPEYLGGGRQTVQFSEVLQTSPSTIVGDEDVGLMRGHGISALRSNRFRRFIEEHGYIFTLFSVRPKTIYGNGLPRHWNRRVKEDFWQKELEHIGQQEVLNKEVYFNHTTPEGVFGFQDRYDEYRRQESSIGGEFRTLLNHWHMARIFASDPALNADFVGCQPTERTFAIPSQHLLYVMANHSIQARRLVSRTGHSHIF